jgi:hypothetical protein
MPECSVSLEQYAELCARMSETAGDVSKEYAIAAGLGVQSADWEAAKAHYTKQMQDPTDIGKTAMAFMPLYQAAQARMRGGLAPCTIETYSKVHAGMAFRKDAADPSKKIDYMLVLAENGFTQPQWLEIEGYWTPRVAMNTDPRFDPAMAARFAELIQAESDRILGIKRG